MILKSLNKYTSFLIFTILFLPLKAEDQIDIWKKKDKKITQENKIENNNNNSIFDSKILNSNKKDISIEGEILKSSEEQDIFGIYDPAENGFSLNMWSLTKAEDIRSSIKRINKINLSKTSKILFEKTLFSYAYPPKGMDDKEFINLKLNWMFKNKRTDLVEKFLNQNEKFYNKKKAVQFIVDYNIAKANIKEGCENINFIDKSLKDTYLERFKIYCLVFNDKKNEAQLLYDILREQNLSDDFFDDKISYLLGITNKTTKKIKEDNLLNFYLSSITIKDFKYEPSKNTKKIIWEYLNAANLIKFEDIADKEKLKSLENAANQGQLDPKKIFDIYKKIPFDLNSLINAQNIYQTLEGSDSRALIYQKFLLSENTENKIQLLFLLKELFKKDNLVDVFTKFLSNRLLEIDKNDIPENYLEVVQKNIILDEKLQLGKIKYDDKILHRSKLLKYFLENTNQKKIQKDFDRIFKKIKRNKKYFYSAKDLALIESFAYDGIQIPGELNLKELTKEYDVPSNLLKLAKNKESAFLTLKIIEIIGEDEPHHLDPETIYFITYLLNETNLKEIRNEVLISALPQRS
tara:strand:+ start:210 stop:1940 length:1731 start_codon:yes stop_codon:yes gene_type:complete